MDKYVNIYREQGEAGLLASEHLKNAAAIADMSMEEFLGSIREWASTDDVNQVLLEQ
jgi:hypothetical protein